MGNNENDEMNKVVSAIKEHSIKTILDMEKDRDKEDVNTLEDIFSFNKASISWNED